MVPPTTRTTPETTLLAHLELLERIIASICRRHALVGDEADDFASWAKAKLIENDYAIIRKFQGRSSISTYLTVVVANLFRDFRTQHWGRWRPSAMAKRLGGLAVRLETLLHRNGHSLTQAIEVLRSSGLTTMSDREISELAARLPARTRPGSAEDPAGEAPPADGELWRSERMNDWDAARGTLERALADLPPEDQLILRLRYWEGFTVAEVARALHLEQKPLYRRIDRDLERLRVSLEAAGVDRESVAGFLSDDVTP
ncbi:MAG TPA: sigma-70 family RNA polymerase sigma factor [Longimicrobiaceae bacterium]|nr:sigma-70 family RNA polymerase sigma factor [Longimicrobiaceae bacterium]